jgi:hypothetical protein
MDCDLDWDEEELAADGDDEDWSSDGYSAVPALSRRLGGGRGVVPPRSPYL